MARFLTFAWWNLHNFSHFDAARSSHARWPKRPEDYEAKRDRILAALREIFGKDDPDLLAVCEITREAAQGLAAMVPAHFEVAVPPPYPRDDGFQVAVFYRSGVGFSPELPLIPTHEEDVPEGTRPMVPVHLTFPGHVIRFVACHGRLSMTRPALSGSGWPTSCGATRTPSSNPRSLLRGGRDTSWFSAA